LHSGESEPKTALAKRGTKEKGGSVKRFLLLGVVVAAVAAVPATSAWAANPHEVNNNPITCEQVGPPSAPAVSCSGSIAGLGTADAVTIEIDAALACETRKGNNQPGGHLQATSEPITPKSGRVNFDDVTTDSASCPNGLRPVVGDFATIRVLDFPSGEVLFTTTVPIN
jgi:hypothetical protein